MKLGKLLKIPAQILTAKLFFLDTQYPQLGIISSVPYAWMRDNVIQASLRQLCGAIPQKLITCHSFSAFLILASYCTAIFVTVNVSKEKDLDGSSLSKRKDWGSWPKQIEVLDYIW